MSTAVFTLLIFARSTIAGLVDSLSGLGGGVVIIPMLTLVFGLDIHYVIGASLISVIATTTGAVLGAAIAAYTPTHFVAILFGVVLNISAFLSLRKKSEITLDQKEGKLASRWEMVTMVNSDNGQIGPCRRP
jgi:uncharacterized membrane protein YfcA